ncbi:hypothetical protein RBB50_011402 [Rhinocladiella similis]
MDENDTSEDAIDGMGAIKFTDEQVSDYFGPSSNIAFLRHISEAFAQASGQRQVTKATLNPSNPTADWVRVTHAQGDISGNALNPSEDGINIYALPSETRTWVLINEYFQKTGQLLPIIHEASFRETFIEMKRSNFTATRRTWLGLVNIILALGCTLIVDGDDTAKERIAESDVYCQRANRLCEREPRRSISLELVQYLLLMGQYLQGTQKSVQAWTVHCLAISTAFQLGLHSPRTNAGFPPVEGEVRKRVWFGCILLDRTLSMTFGRPCIISEKHVRLELPSANIQIMGQTPDSAAIQHMDARYFQATIKLNNILYEVLDTCYEQNIGPAETHADAEILSITLKGDQQLDEWRSQIVPALGLRILHTPLVSQDLGNFELKDKIVERFNLVLSLRFHNLRILNHRRILEKFLDSTNGVNDVEASMIRQVYVSSIETCLESSINIVAIVHHVVLSHGWRRDLLGAWNYSLFYTFNAGLVLIAALLVAVKGSGTERVQTLPSWKYLDNAMTYVNMAVEALQNLDQGNRVVQGIVDYLSHLAMACSSLLSNNPGTTHNVTNVNQHDPHAATGNSLRPQQAPQAGASYRAFSQQPEVFNMESNLSGFMLDTDVDSFFRLSDPDSLDLNGFL